MEPTIYAADQCEGYATRWACPPPIEGDAFKVIRQEWTEDYTVRTIYEWVRSPK